MLRFLKRLFGMDESLTPHPPDVPNSSTINSRNPAETGDSSNKYFETMGKLQEAISKRNYMSAARFTRENIHQISAFVRNTKQEYGTFDISTIPALEQGGTMLALEGDDQGLRAMRRIVISNPELNPWNSFINRHEQDMHLFKAILEAVEKNPQCLQTGVKKLVGTEDGRRVANLISWLEKAGRINRTKKGRSFALTITGSVQSSNPVPKIRVKSHRTERVPIRCREIDLQSLPYVPLPRSPLRWEKTRGKNKTKPVEQTSQWFEILDSVGWKLLSVEKLTQDERPDPAFRRIYPMETGLIMVDDLGNSDRSGEAPAAAVLFGRDGNLIKDAQFYHDVYRIGVNALGRGLIVMSRDCVAYAYDDSLKCILETSLSESPEVHALQKRLEIGTAELKNYLRCIAMSYDNSRYLFTGVDEAWCVDIEGRGLWGVKLPVKEGWSRIAEPSSTFGTRTDIISALELMNLTFPYSAEDLKQRYRNLAKQWHPDLNPADPNAEAQMKALNRAAELLTGINPRGIARYTGAKFMKEFSKQEFIIRDTSFTLTMGMQLSEIDVADWIYAASFSGRSQDVFLAGYSGKIIQINRDGHPIRAYDIGAVPRQIIDTGDYLYLLTDTRLYILRDDSLLALMDTSESGELFVAQTGFGLLQNKRFQWFRENGTHLGTIATKNPIRRIYYTPQGMVVETRQRRAIIGGVTTWWE